MITLPIAIIIGAIIVGFSLIIAFSWRQSVIDKALMAVACDAKNIASASGERAHALQIEIHSIRDIMFEHLKHAVSRDEAKSFARASEDSVLSKVYGLLAPPPPLEKTNKRKVARA